MDRLWYGRLGVSWGLGIGTYLDPASCGGTTIINDGWDPNAVTTVDDASIQGISSPAAELCGDNFDPVVTLKNARNERINICHNLIQY